MRVDAGRRSLVAATWTLGGLAHAQGTGSLAALPLRRDDANAPSLAAPWVFVVLLAAIAVAAVGYRRMRKAARPASASLQRIESLPLTAHASLHVVRWGDEEFLLGSGPSGVGLLARRPSDVHATGHAP